MDITYNEWNMGYIYLQDNYCCDEGETAFKRINSTLTADNKLSEQLNKLNWADKKYVEAKNKDFIEEFQNDLADDLSIKGIEFEMKSKKFKKLIDSYQIKSFKFRDNQYYCICFAPEAEIFEPKNYIYAFSEEENSFAIFKLKAENNYNIAFFKALIFSEESSYNIDYFKTLNRF
ncbi:hypothetical protein [Halanaerobium praevalens]|uniref:Uncharacterized protein n=1 Tax=Halanaerobium praevalens (strain ATCC 33744 / DSM 2228 / GSL) TaxID=572479 RepID=E3DLU6_HALPG|nr:hypothetical protein [Halanaerobium praevalens]ADO76205.1 hypothetical protein Hprae_0044 [Halanaerobium praevalens DSM 2228]